MFDSPYFVHIQDSQRSKLNSKVKGCIFFDFKKVVKGYKLWDLSSHKVVISQDVVYDEERMLKLNWLKEDKV